MYYDVGGGRSSSVGRLVGARDLRRHKLIHTPFRSTADTQLPTSPFKALATFHELRALSVRLGPLQQAAEGAAPHVVDYIEHTVAEVRQHLRDAFAADLELVLEKTLWPKKATALPASLVEAFNAACGKLLSLQKPELVQTDHDIYGNSPKERSAVLLPLEVLVEPLAARFRFHFLGDRPTNRPDKPEYVTSHFFDVLGMHVDFVNEYVQPLLLEHFQDSSHRMSLGYLDATTALITALLPMLREKVSILFEQISTQPQLLSHLMQELMSFDTTLREDWHYDGGMDADCGIWRGITGEVLAQDSHFERWLSVESTFAIDRYESIISDPSNGVLNYDEVPPHTTKPSTAAVRIYELIENTTQTYRPLTSLGQKLHFLIHIQTVLLDQYRTRLHDGIQAYLSATTTLGRNITLQGSSSSPSASAAAAAETKSMQGVAGFERVCRILGSADYLERSMRDWNDELFFVDLWNQLQKRIQSQDTLTTPITGKMHVEEIASRISNSLARVADGDDGYEEVDPAAGAMFDEPAAKYGDLRARAENVLIDALRYQVSESLRPYLRTSGFVDAAAAGGDQAPTSSLAGTLGFLQESFMFLARALAPLLLHRVAMAVLRATDGVLFAKAILAKDFGESGAGQLRVDLETVAGSVETACARVVNDGGRGLSGGGAGERWRRGLGKLGLVKCFEAVQLLSLNADKDGDGQGKDEEVDEQEAWGEAEDTNQAHDKQMEATPPLTHLWTVEGRLFASNESARTVLGEMGIVSLTEWEARKVLKCRIELGN